MEKISLIFDDKTVSQPLDGSSIAIDNSVDVVDVSHLDIIDVAIINDSRVEISLAEGSVHTLNYDLSASDSDPDAGFSLLLPAEAGGHLTNIVSQIFSIVDFNDNAVSYIKFSSQIFDMSADGGNSSVRFNLTDVLNLIEVSNTLDIEGSAGDSLTLENTSNGQTGSWSLSVDGGGTDTCVFTSGADLLASVLVNDNLTVNII